VIGYVQTGHEAHYAMYSYGIFNKEYMGIIAETCKRSGHCLAKFRPVYAKSEG
jgi:hypothetical protein